MSEFDGKLVLVTGAAGNLGQAVAAAFAAQGARLALVDLNEDGLRATAAAMPTSTQTACFPTNLIDPESVAASVAAVQQQLGPIDVLANIAGGFTMGPPVHETDDKSWDFMMDLNARSVFNTARAVVPGMLIKGHGRIINVSARAAREGKARMGPYCASKAAVITLTETLAAEHKHAGINVNCILPGTIDTPQNRQDMPDADHSHWVPPAALADVVVFLASDASRCVTGASIPVFGQS
jgi:NAD(P)-dependent dehydrogenase (short-subunit alcohol dehydrogenase family)